MMKKRIFASVLTFILILSTFAFSSCQKEGEPTEYGFIDPNTGIEYVYCNSLGLYAVEKGEEYINVGEQVFYTVEFEDPTRFLCIEDTGELLLLRAKDVKEPDVKSFNPIAAQIYNDLNNVFITYFYADNKYLPEELQETSPTEDSWLCQLIAESIATGEATEVAYDDVSEEDMYFIRLLSQDYPGLYYVVVFFGDTNGRYYLIDRSIQKTVYCPRDIILRMVGE